MDQNEKARLVESIDEKSTDEEVLETLEELLLDLLDKDPDAISDLGAIATLGSVPIDKAVLDDALEFAEAVLIEPSAEVWSLILGRTEWLKTQLDDLLRLRSGSTLRVYSQELFVSMMVTGLDPLDQPADEIRNDAGTHPGLQYLEEVGFDWPTTIVGPAHGRDGLPPMLKNGFLSFRGYRVGKSGEDRQQRRTILKRVLNDKLPKIFPFEYRREWGEPASSVRLEKTAKSIAAFCRNMKKKRDSSYDLAIAEYEEDLDWLRSTYYRDRPRFRWPDIEVW